MSGHNKWSKIKNRKAVTDAQKSKIFTKVVRLLTVEAKKAHGDVTAPGLATAIAKAREANMPGDNIDRAVKKASSDPATMEQIIYEAYGPGGCAMVIETLTDNRNKAAQEIKFILGGPEVSYETEGQKIVELADHVITGEADLKFAEVCQQLLNGRAGSPLTAVALIESDRRARSDAPYLSARGDARPTNLCAFATLRLCVKKCFV